MSITLYWHDYETFGANPKIDKPAQFAGIRTDLELNEIGEPLEIFCQPPDDYLPDPQSTMITGITPQMALEKGLPEAEFIRQVHQELSAPGTCGVGYNTVRFDDEVTRNTLYRNFYDAYAREWQNQNSRWDLLDVARLCYAVRPGGIEWPLNEEGKVSFKLEHLTAANGLSHSHAHDALSDVRATIDLARLIKLRQPKLYQYAFDLRSKQEVLRQLDVASMKPVLHISGMFRVEHGCAAIVAPVAQHPRNKNSIIVYDLRKSPALLSSLSVPEIRQRIFTSTAELEKLGLERIGLKELHINKCPIVAPIAVLEDQRSTELNIDKSEHARHWQELKAIAGLPAKLREVFDNPYEQGGPVDVDQALYSGGFFSEGDRKRMQQIVDMDPDSLADSHFAFDDPRLEEMLFRYRARNFPHSLFGEELVRWEEHRHRRLILGDGGQLSLKAFQARIKELRGNSEKQDKLLDELEDYGFSLTRGMGT